MTSAQKIAEYFIFLASVNIIGDNGEREGITNLKLQKLLYLAEAYSLAKNSKSLFREEIQAWAFGPVVPAVYKKYKHCKSSPIIDTDVSKPKLENWISDSVEIIWKEFGKYSASRLVDITHSHLPWKNAYKKFEETKSPQVISRSSMQTFYKGLFV